MMSLALLIFATYFASAESLDVIADVDKSFLEKPVAYTWGSDPFLKTPGFVPGAPKEEKMDLKAILHDEAGRSLAIVNKQTVFVNSVIQGYVVREIGPNYVVMEKGSSLRELQMPPIQNRVHSDISIWDRVPAAEADAEQPEEKGDSP